MTDTSRRITLACMAAGILAMAGAGICHFAFPPQKAGQTSFAQPSADSGKVSSAPAEADPGLMEAMRRMQENANDVDALLEAARIFYDDGKTEQAMSLAQKAAITAPSDHRPPYLMGVLLAGQKKWDEAVRNLERSIAIKDDPSARYSAAVIYRYHLKQEDKAKSYFDMASRLCDDTALAAAIKAELEK